jgi:serine phosphatase RsbU (regulator of sigma subunit)
VVTNVALLGMGEFRRKLRERNQQLEQTVEKGTIALQQQEEKLKRAREIQQMLLPSTLSQLAGVQIAGAWQPAREVGGDYFDVIQLDKDRLGICVGELAERVRPAPSISSSRATAMSAAGANSTVDT